ncbi:enoyl-CoA hydratase/isomerase family protein [Kribbia dieselivorans]|uniref:enoyl-CoA hydratase/isomerase family protein n=1 Tax=Kribbia dieselivorans TaxID=331526 RepID=UPI000839A99E|nr:enoyl-CoA hydratase/isomerase family protein [Kribbia dieselivorans]
MTSKDAAPVTVQRSERGVATITLNRPDAMNTLNADLVRALLDTFAEIGADRSIRVVVLTGAGRAFCAGLDLNGYGDDPRADDQGLMLGTFARQREIVSVAQAIRALPQPVIAAVNGAAAGGGLALVCAADIRIAVSTAVFAVGFIRAGFSACDIGVSWLLPRIMGAGRAHELMLTGRRFEAAEALAGGLLSRVVEPGVLAGAVDETVGHILANPPASVELTKAGMWIALETPAWNTSIEFENRQQMITAMTEDRREATASFLERRPPVYQHR